LVLALENEVIQIRSLLSRMGLNEYQSSALAYLLFLGETKATTLSKISKVPSARIYGVLDKLGKMGLVSIRPGRPALYDPRPPDDVASSLVSLSVDELKQNLKILEKNAEDFVKASELVYLKGEEGVPKIPLLRIVSVGDVSLEETKRMYDAAKDEIRILSKAMEYFSEVTEILKEVSKRSVSLKILLMDPKMLDSTDRRKQTNTLERIKSEIKDCVEVRFTDEMPIRGCIVDPKAGGKALFLVEDPGVPYFLREAAITSHQSVVKGLGLMYDLLWMHRSTKP
jgi:sugar-specific transcriptional regulator TrmB